MILRTAAVNDGADWEGLNDEQCARRAGSIDGSARSELVMRMAEISAFVSFADRIRDHSASAPDSCAIWCDGYALSYEQWLRRAEACAATLQAKGFVAGGDRRVGVLASNCIDFTVVILACQLARITVVPLPGLISPDSQARMISDANVHILFHDLAHGEKASEAIELVGPAIEKVPIGPQPGGSTHCLLDDWVDQDAVFEATVLDPEWSSDFIYSSGTTGTPKGIVQSYGARAQQCLSLAAIGMGPSIGMLNTVGLYSNFGMAGFTLTCWWGGTFYMMAKFSASECVRLLDEVPIGVAWVAPATLIRIVDESGFEAAVQDKSCVKLCAGAPLSAAQKQQVLNAWQGPFYDLYGQTETGTLSLLAMHEAPDTKLGSVGKLLPTVTVRILGEDDEILGTDEIGEIAGYSTTMMTGYHRRDDANATVYWKDPEGRKFVKTGDVGKLDPDGYLWLSDRKKDMIISGGFNIYPADIEHIFMEHAAVFEAAVVGWPSARWGESPVAFITLRDGETVDEDTLRIWVNERVASIQRVAAVRILPALPQGTLGKTLKRELRETYADEIGQLA